MCIGCREKNKIIRELKLQSNWQRDESVSLKKVLLDRLKDQDLYIKQHQLVMSKLFFLEKRIDRISR